MRAVLVHRLVALVPVLFGVSVLVFGLIHMAPGSPIAAMLGATPSSPQDVARLSHELGLDQPLPVQYGKWLLRVVHGDLGTSVYAHTPVTELIRQRLPVTLELALGSLLLSVLVGVPLGVASATRRGGVLDGVGRVAAVLGVSMPVFWLGLLLIIVFALRLRVLPAGGSPADLGLRALILPVATLSAAFAAIVLRITRATVLEVMGEDYIRAARSKGLPEWRVQYRHALGNAWVPIVTVIGLQVGTLLSGAVLTETVFGIPGLGLLVINAAAARDYPLVLGSVLVIALVYVFVNLLVDLLYLVLNPRLRYP